MLTEEKKSEPVVDGTGRQMRMVTSPGTILQQRSHGRTTLYGGTSITKGDRLNQAAQAGDVAKVRKLLKAGVSPDYRNPNAGCTSLALASENNNVTVLTLLLDAKATVDAQSDLGSTALMLAVQFEHVASIEVLLKRGADPNLRCHAWVTRPRDASPVDIASRHGRTRALAMLLDAKADVNARTKDGWTAILCAAWGRSIETCKMLIDANADSTIATSDGSSAIQIAVLSPDRALQAAFPQHLLASTRAMMEKRVGGRPLHTLPERVEWPAMLGKFVVARPNDDAPPSASRAGAADSTAQEEAQRVEEEVPTLEGASTSREGRESARADDEAEVLCPYATLVDVVVVGLSARPELNGRRGRVVSPPNANGRVGTKVEGLDGLIALRPANIVPAGSKEAAAATAAVDITDTAVALVGKASAAAKKERAKQPAAASTDEYAAWDVSKVRTVLGGLDCSHVLPFG